MRGKGALFAEGGEALCAEGREALCAACLPTMVQRCLYASLPWSRGAYMPPYVRTSGCTSLPMYVPQGVLASQVPLVGATCLPGTVGRCYMPPMVHRVYLGLPWSIGCTSASHDPRVLLASHDPRVLLASHAAKSASLPCCEECQPPMLGRRGIPPRARKEGYPPGLGGRYTHPG